MARTPAPFDSDEGWPERREQAIRDMAAAMVMPPQLMASTTYVTSCERCHALVLPDKLHDHEDWHDRLTEFLAGLAAGQDFDNIWSWRL